MGVIAVSAVVVVVGVLVGVVVVVVAAGAVVWRRRSRAVAPPPAAEMTAPKAPRVEPAPMTGLEDALKRATDRSGTTMADRLDAEAGAVEGLRVGDDTGPLLRRALDRFGHADAGDPDAPRADDSGERSETRPPHAAE